MRQKPYNYALQMKLWKHILVQNSNDLHNTLFTYSVEYYVATLWELLIAYFNMIASYSYILIISKLMKTLVKLQNVGVSLNAPPSLFCKYGNLL